MRTKVIPNKWLLSVLLILGVLGLFFVSLDARGDLPDFTSFFLDSNSSVTSEAELFPKQLVDMGAVQILNSVENQKDTLQLASTELNTELIQTAAIREAVSMAVTEPCATQVDCANTGMPFTIVPTNPPGIVTLISPSGAQSSAPSTYSWNDTGDATEYQMHIWDTNAGATAHFQLYTAAANCNGTTCSVPSTGITLTPGTPYVWWVRGVNAGGSGPWSTNLSFNIASSGLPPVQTTLIAPSGSQASAPATYQWNDTGDATDYQIHIWDTNVGATNHWQLYDAATNCNGTTCSVPSTGITLTPGTTYVWWIRGVNAAGNGPWSTYLSFNIAVGGSLPVQTTLIAPSGPQGSAPTTYEWNDTGDATDYQIHIWDTSVAATAHWQLYDAATNCNGTTCSVPSTGITLNTDISYVWWIRGVNAVGNGPWSPYLSFNIPSIVAAASINDVAALNQHFYLPLVAGSNTPDELYFNSLDPEELYFNSITPDMLLTPAEQEQFSATGQ